MQDILLERVQDGELNKKNIKKCEKILFISPRNPFSGRYSGDVIRAHKFINFLKKKIKLR